MPKVREDFFDHRGLIGVVLRFVQCCFIVYYLISLEYLTLAMFLTHYLDISFGVVKAGNVAAELLFLLPETVEKKKKTGVCFFLLIDGDSDAAALTHRV